MAGLFKGSLNVKLISLVLIVAILSIAIAGIFAYTGAKNALEEDEITNLEAIANLKVVNIERFFEKWGDDATVVQDYFNVKTNLPILIKFANDRTNQEYITAEKNLDGQLQTFQRVYGYDDVMLVNPEGKIVYVSNKAHAEVDLGSSLPDPAGKAFEEGKKGLYISEVFKEVTGREGHFSMIIASPATDFDGNFIGVIALEVDMDPIFELIQDTTGLGETGETLIAQRVSDSALILNPLRHDPDAALKRTITIGSDESIPMQKAVNEQDGSGISTDYRDEEIIAAWRYIPSLEWGLVAKIDTSEAFAPVQKLLIQIVIIGLIIAFLAVIITFFFARIISTPISKAIKTLQSSSSQLASSSQEVSSGVQQVSSASQQMAASAQEQTKQVEESGKVIQNMSGAIQQAATNSSVASEAAQKTGKIAEEGRANAEKAVLMVKEMKDTIVNSTMSVKELGGKSKKIGDIVGTIKDIADQTNLLALNAAIEAARAGEAGRGFAVVAEEVRKLAEESSEASDQISEIIGALQDSTEQAVGSMEKGSKNVIESSEVITKALDSLTTISESVQGISSQMQEISSAAQQQSAGIQQSMGAMNKIATSAEQTSVGAEQISAATQQQSTAVQQIASSSQELSSLVEDLSNVIGGSKTKYVKENNEGVEEELARRAKEEMKIIGKGKEKPKQDLSALHKRLTKLVDKKETKPEPKPSRPTESKALFKEKKI